MTDTKASAGAMRAARSLEAYVYQPDYSQHHAAEIIDGETHVAELVEALESMILAEWMVSPDWSGSAKRNEVVIKAESALRRFKEGL